jgi:translation initiation factor 2 alpha subunit (eIF-2alpha)
MFVLSLQINLIAPPSFVLTMTVMDKDRGLQLLQQACDTIAAKIKELGGDMTVKVPVS